MIAITIPFPPSANSYISHSRGIHFPTKKAKAFRIDVARAVKAAGVQSLGTVRLQMTLTLHPPTRTLRDIDNYCKPAIDALAHAGCFVNDEQIDSLIVHRGPIIKGGAARVEIAPHPVQPREQTQAPLPLPRELTARDVRDRAIDASIPFA